MELPQNLRPKMQSFRVLIDAQFLPRRPRGLVYSSLHEIQVNMSVEGEFIVYPNDTPYKLNMMADNHGRHLL